MGEYARRKSDGSEIKIGTCESMYYLRADQVDLVEVIPGNVDPITDPRAHTVRFRFPFPDEDNTKPGEFKEFERYWPVWGMTAPDGVEHGTTQFSSGRYGGYLISLPCPESAEAATLPFKIHRNGGGAAVRIVQQRPINGVLALVCQCGGCDHAWRYESLEDVKPILDSLREEADECSPERWGNGSYGKDHPRIDESKCATLREIANRIEAGYTQPNRWQ